MTTLDFNNRLLEHNNSLKGFAYNLTRNSDDALDLLQETFLKALIYKNSFSHTSNFKAWIMTIMKNTFINTYNRGVKGEFIKDEIMYTRSAHYNNIETKLTIGEINNALNKLKDEYKIPMVRYIEGYQYNEIAEELKLPIGTIKSRIFTARTKITNLLKDSFTNYNV